MISLDDGTTEANLCKQNYDPIKKAVLEDAQWSFATKRVTLAPAATPPAFGFNVRFLLPSDVLRVISVSDSPDDRSEVIWEKEGRYILCESNAVYVKYISNVDDPSVFSPMFIQCLAARLAADMAIPLTKSRTLQQDMFQLYDMKLKQALVSDSMQGKSKRIVSSWLKRARNR